MKGRRAGIFSPSSGSAAANSGWKILSCCCWLEPKNGFFSGIWYFDPSDVSSTRFSQFYCTITPSFPPWQRGSFSLLLCFWLCCSFQIHFHLFRVFSSLNRSEHVSLLSLISSFSLLAFESKLHLVFIPHPLTAPMIAVLCPFLSISVSTAPRPASDLQKHSHHQPPRDGTQAL